ncbi:MAG: hypothetical protein JRH11_14490, partial [Deltaproteobacteria bacterium]|nr:hypothetical protein [Deltaproteobacteria bacterium]
DLRTDIYSMGVILYEALSGECPFREEHVGDLIISICTSTAEPLYELRPDLGKEFSDVVERAMARERADRYATAKEMSDALRKSVGKISLASATWGTAVTGSFRPPAMGLAANAAPKSLDNLPRRPLTPIPGSNDPPTEDHQPSRLPEAPLAKAPARRRGWVAIAVGLAVLGTVIGIGVSWPGDDAGDSVGELPAPEVPATVAVSLEGVPEGALVRVDGQTVDGETVEFDVSESLHVIEVAAAGYVTWRIGHRATEGAVYQVELQALPVAEVEDEAGSNMSAAMRTSRRNMRPRGMRRSMQGMPRTMQGGLYRDPGF